MKKLTRKKAEAQILEHLKAIREIAAEYMGREPDYLAMSVQSENGYMQVNNKYYGDDKDKPIERYWWTKESKRGAFTAEAQDAGD